MQTVDKTRWVPICCVRLLSSIISCTSDLLLYLYCYDENVSVWSRLHQLSTYLLSLDAGTNIAPTSISVMQ